MGSIGLEKMMFKWMFNCREVTKLVSESLDRELPLWVRMGIRFHLLMCKLCPEAKKQILFLRQAMSHFMVERDLPGSKISLSPEAKERIKLALKEK